MARQVTAWRIFITPKNGVIFGVIVSWNTKIEKKKIRGKTENSTKD
jgi:hypothetical protein